MKYTIGICDDDLDQVALVKHYLNHFQCDDELTIMDSTEPERFILLLEHYKPQIVFLDVDMGEVNGIELGKRIRKLYENIVIVYITAYEKYAIDAFQTRAFQYLLKPMTFEKFSEVLTEVLEYLKKVKSEPILKKFIVKTKKEIVCIDCKDIFYFEKTGHQIRICSKAKDIYYYYNFSKLLEEIDEEMFVRCHQGYIVNIGKIKSYRNRTLFLNENLELPVSRPYLEKVKFVLGKKLFAERL